MGRGTDHALWLRGLLRAERERRGWSLSQCARAVAREMGKANLTKQSFTRWESFESQPRIDQFAAWARALGFRLEVDLVPADAPGVLVRVPADVAAAARELAVLPVEVRGPIIALIAGLQAPG